MNNLDVGITLPLAIPVAIQYVHTQRTKFDGRPSSVIDSKVSSSGIAWVGAQDLGSELNF